MLNYALHQTKITDAPDDYHAIPQNVISYQLCDLLEEMVVPGGVTTTQAAAVLESFMGAQEKILKRGGSINTEFYNIYPRISGKFTSPDDNFDPGRHQVHFSVRMGTRFQPLASQITPQKVAAKLRVPELSTYIDSASGTNNQTLTPGKVGEIKGEYLKLDPTDTEQGVFFISGTNTYRSETYLRNTNSTLMFYIPDQIEAGEYKIEVRTILPGNREMRTGALSGTVTAA